MDPSALRALLDHALDSRSDRLDAVHTSAARLFNGFFEGWPQLAIDLYGTTVVVHDHGPTAAPAHDDVAASEASLAVIEPWVREALPWVTAMWVKRRRSPVQAERNGIARFGVARCRKIRERGTWYALDLTLNRDASLYLDTRALRAWLEANVAGQRVLNTFAYTGSLGVAARAAPAQRVIQTDLNRAFLNVAKVSYGLNGWPVARADFRAGDFFDVASTLKKQGALFDCALVDPPFFSSTLRGTVDLQAELGRLLNKVRPLVGDGGRLVVVNNALFVSGAAYLKDLEALGAGGYLEVEALIPVDPDCAPPGSRAPLPADPAPFNHPTKIAVLRVKRKDGRKAR